MTALEPEEHFKTPEWVSRLENKHKRHHKLAHEVGSGSNCLKCGDGCPGLDLHFWRKVCRNCKCKREDHDIVDEDQYKQLDILFNDSKANYQPVKAVLNMIIKPDGQFIKKPDTDLNQNSFKFDWVPPNVHKDLASEYMQLLPSDKLPISGSEGALYRRQQLEKQVPLHDFNANVCHNLTTEEADAMSSYLQNLKENAVGQGLVKKLTNNPLPSFKNMNIAPKPLLKACSYQQQIEEDEFPPPPPELLYPSNTELKTPSTFIGNKNYTRKDQSQVNKLDNVNNNPAICDQQVISRTPTSNIVRSENLPQNQTKFSSGIHNDNYKPVLYNKDISDSLKNPLWEDSKEFTSANADMCVLEGKDLLCKQCRGNVIPGQVAVLAERIGKEVLWHPQCFVCTTCEELLVDLVYFLFKDNVYCGRHYAEILNIPRCHACDELIFLKEYTIAEEHTYHVRHFCCFECDKPLAGLEYVSIENQPVCLDCYQDKHGKKCETCLFVIMAGENRIGWKDLSWHQSPDCFKCYQCFMSLLGKNFTVKAERRPLCSKECVIAFNNSTEL